MRQSGEDVSVNDCLTSYLKNFKTDFNAQLSMIESLLTTDLPSISQKIQKASESTRALTEQPLNIHEISLKLNSKTLQRFCLRINEYIEYRASKCKSCLEQPGVVEEINGMCVAMHRLFAEFNGANGKGEQSLAVLFVRIEEVENHYFVRILKKIMQLLQLGKIHDYGTEDLGEIIGKIEKVREQKGLKISQKIQIERTLPTESSTSHERRLDFSRRFSDSHYASRLRSRKSTFERMQNIPGTSTALPLPQPSPNTTQFYKPKQNYANSHLLLRNPEDLGQLSMETNLVQSTKMAKTSGHHFYGKIADVVEIGEDTGVKPTAESLMRELLENNKVNQAIIHKYRRKATKIKLRFKLDMQMQKEREMEKQCLSPLKQRQGEPKTLDMQVRHKRSYTLDTSNSKPNVKKEEKFLGLPSLKRKSIKN